jgi:hypothetical protein
MSPEPVTPAADFLTGDPRKDGWTPEREAGFIAHLADNGVVAAACRAVGMGVSGAYALRRRSDGIAFSLGWHAALRLARQRLLDMMMARAIEGDEIVTIRDGEKTVRRSCNPKIAFGMLDQLAATQGTSLASVICHDFEPFLAIIAEGGSHAAIRAYFTARIDHVQTLDSLLATLPLTDKSVIFPTDILDDFCLMDSKGDICCNFPPPPGFSGREEGKFGDDDYCRTLTEGEELVIMAQSEAAGCKKIEDYVGRLEDDGLNGLHPGYIALANEARDLYFGFVPESAPEMAVT